MKARQITVSTVTYNGYPLSLAVHDIAALQPPYVEPAYIKGYMDATKADFSVTVARDVSLPMQTEGVSAIATPAHMDTGHRVAIQRLARLLRFTARIGARYKITNSTSHDKRGAF